MISAIVYGRNDSYGYNLHKRAALSLNNFGHLLGDDDEIIFVDYNTPTGFPTFPEAISDTLTDRTRGLLRILRVTEEQHQLLAPNTHLKTLEPVARNVALRRSNPGNRWILSTNTDMVFIPRDRTTLHESLRSLPDGQYGLPRFELPEGLWEGLDRAQPGSVLTALGDWALAFHLNQVAESWLPHGFDGPGDFQLMLRQDLVDMNGFDERMTLGWHVDSNIAKRVSMRRGNASDLSHILVGFHCDHTRQETPAHVSGAPQNSTFRFVDAVTSSETNRGKNWGLEGVDVEEIRLDRSFSARLSEALRETIQPQRSAPPTRRYNASGYDVDPPNGATVVTFLLDLVASHGPHPRILWLGPESEVSEIFFAGIKKMSKSLSWHIAPPKGLVYSRRELRTVPKPAGFDFVVMDFRAFWGQVPDVSGRRPTELLSLLRKWWWNQAKPKTGALGSKFVAIDAINTSVETELNLWTSCGRTPYSVGISHGNLRKKNFSHAKLYLRSILKGRISTVRRIVIGDENVGTWVSKKLRFRLATSANKLGLFRTP